MNHISNQKIVLRKVIVEIVREAECPLLPHLVETLGKESIVEYFNYTFVDLTRDGLGVW